MKHAGFLVGFVLVQVLDAPRIERSGLPAQDIIIEHLAPQPSAPDGFPARLLTHYVNHYFTAFGFRAEDRGGLGGEYRARLRRDAVTRRPAQA
jgi:hypothetical protein